MSNDQRAQPRRYSRERGVLLFALGVIVAVLVALFWRPLYAPMTAWAVCCLAYLAMIWVRIWGLDGPQTADHATQEDPGRRVVDLLLIVCAVGTAVDLFVVLWISHEAGSTGGRAAALLGLFSVVLNWALLQTLFTMRYADMYYAQGGGIDFNQVDYQPTYRDFAYLSFDLGMTFQVSDTSVSSPAIRTTILGHTLLSYVFTTLVLANVINVIVGLLP